MAASTRSRSSAQSATPPAKRPICISSPPSARLPRPTPAQIRAFRLKSPRLRLITVWLVLIVGMLGLAGRLAYLQLFIGTELQRIAKEQQTILATPRAARRQMVDRQGNVVAMDRVVYTLYVHPMLFKKSDKTIAEALSGVLERSPQELLALFAEQESGIKLSSDISEETAERLQGLRLDGLDLLPSPQRMYPQGELFSQMTGYTDLEGCLKRVWSSACKSS